jgi:tripartite motif-containing protein 71
LKKLPQQEPYVNFVWKTPAPELMYVSVDQQGNIYTSTGRPGGFSKYDPTGKLLKNWPIVNEKSGKPIRWAEGVTFDAQGNIYVANWDQAKIQKFDPNGNLLTSWGVSEVSHGLAGPLGMGMDAQGNLYVVVGADGGTVDHYIEKYDPQGKLLGSWAKSGSGEGEIKPTNAGGGIRLSGIAVDPAGNNYLADPQGNRVSKYDANGNFLYSLTGDGENKFWHSWHVTLDSQQNIYVIDNTHLIWKFDREGKFVGKWRTLLGGEMAFAKDGNLLIADRAGFLAEVTLPMP